MTPEQQLEIDKKFVKDILKLYGFSSNYLADFWIEQNHESLQKLIVGYLDDMTPAPEVQNNSNDDANIWTNQDLDKQEHDDYLKDVTSQMMEIIKNVQKDDDSNRSYQSLSWS